MVAGRPLDMLILTLNEDVEEDEQAEEDLCEVAWHEVFACKNRTIGPI